MYAQDQWTMKRMTVNMGLRLDYFRSDYPDQNVPPTQFVPVARNFPGAGSGELEGSEPAARACRTTCSATARRRSKSSANRYVLGEGVDRASTINPIQSNNTMTRQWTDSNSDRDRPG